MTKAKHRIKPLYGTGIPRPDDIGGLTPWDEVTRMWNEVSGEPPISDTRVQQIAANAEKKIYSQLAGVAREWFYEKKR